jgi:hypothetical protein
MRWQFLPPGGGRPLPPGQSFLHIDTAHGAPQRPHLMKSAFKAQICLKYRRGIFVASLLDSCQHKRISCFIFFSY